MGRKGEHKNKVKGIVYIKSTPLYTGKNALGSYRKCRNPNFSVSGVPVASQSHHSPACLKVHTTVCAWQKRKPVCGR
jgi:hypothetical protein